MKLRLLCHSDFPLDLVGVWPLWDGHLHGCWSSEAEDLNAGPTCVTSWLLTYSLCDLDLFTVR